MKTNSRLGLAAVFAGLIAAPVAFARDAAAPGQMMGSPGTMDGIMSSKMSGMQGMMSMMQMMQQVGPMLEACTEMVQAISTQPDQVIPKIDG